MNDEITIIDKLLTSIWAGAVGMTVWAFKRNKEKLDNISDRVIRLESQSVSKDQVRDIIKEELNEVKSDVTDIKNIVTELRIQQARRD